MLTLRYIRSIYMYVHWIYISTLQFVPLTYLLLHFFSYTLLNTFVVCFYYKYSCFLSIFWLNIIKAFIM